MIFDSEYFKEIKKEETYLTTLYEQGSLKIYMRYGEVGDFYSRKISELKDIMQNSNNHLLESIYNTLISTLEQVNYITEEYKKGNDVDVQPLFDLFFTKTVMNKEGNKPFYK